MPTESCDPLFLIAENMYDDKKHPLAHLCPMEEMSEADMTQCFVVMTQGREGREGTGCTSCDFCDFTMLFFRPGECKPALERLTDRRAFALCFSGEWLDHSLDTCESWRKRYSFFRYDVKESLHLSLREKAVIDKCMADIRDELEWGIDDFSNALIARRIGILLDECRRFYERQFITRSCANQSLMAKIEREVDAYVASGEFDLCKTCAPTARFASLMGMSEAFFVDFLKFEKGKTLSQYLCFRHFEVAKAMLRSSGESVACIAKRLGYASAQCFCGAFKRVVGCAPSEFRDVC